MYRNNLLSPKRMEYLTEEISQFHHTLSLSLSCSLFPSYLQSLHTMRVIQRRESLFYDFICFLGSRCESRTKSRSNFYSLCPSPPPLFSFLRHPTDHRMDGIGVHYQVTSRCVCWVNVLALSLYCNLLGDCLLHPNQGVDRIQSADRLAAIRMLEQH